MAENNDEFCSPIEASHVKKGSYLMLNGHPCKISDVKTSKTGKHGHMKCRITGSDVISAEKIEIVKPGHTTLQVPAVLKTEYQLSSIAEREEKSASSASAASEGAKSKARASKAAAKAAADEPAVEALSVFDKADNLITVECEDSAIKRALFGAVRADLAGSASKEFAVTILEAPVSVGGAKLSLRRILAAWKETELQQ